MNTPNDQKQSIWRRELRSSRVWLILWAATFVILLLVTASIGKLPWQFGDLYISFVFSVVGVGASFVLWLLVRRIRPWRNLRWVLFGIACLVTLIGLFYAEEDWRGKHDWESYKRQWEAKGEKFDLAAFVPPAVPADENFALKPVVASSYNYILDSDGKKIPDNQRDTNHVDRLNMSIYRERDWGKLKQGDWTRAVPTDLKAFQKYYRTPVEATARSEVESATNEFPTTAQPQSPAADVLTALGKYDQAIDDLRKAAQLPYSRFPLNYNAQPPASILLPHLAGLKGCSEVLDLRAAAELEDGKSGAAADDILLTLRLAESVRKEPFLVTHLVRVRMIENAITPLWEGLTQHTWSDAQLVRLDKALMGIDFLKDYEFAMRGECALSIANIDYFRQAREIRMIEDFSPDNVFAFFLPFFPTGWFYQNDLTIAQLHRDMLIPAVNVTNRTVSPESATKEANYSLNRLEHRWPYNFIAQMLVPQLESMVQKFAYAQESVDLARVAIALERYRLANGDYPETLAPLSPQFITKLPHDIIGGQPLHYRRTDNGQFVLYSIGWNASDDGGQIELGKRRNPRLDITKGDWVWRFPEK